MSKHKESRPASNQKIPSGHFDREGMSQGKSSGQTRPADAYQGERKEHDTAQRKPGN